MYSASNVSHTRRVGTKSGLFFSLFVRIVGTDLDFFKTIYKNEVNVDRSFISDESRPSWLILKMSSKGVFSYNQPCQYFMERMGFLTHQRNRRLKTSYFLIFDGKQHPKNIWFYGY